MADSDQPQQLIDAEWLVEEQDAIRMAGHRLLGMRLRRRLVMIAGRVTRATASVRSRPDRATLGQIHVNHETS